MTSLDTLYESKLCDIYTAIEMAKESGCGFYIIKDGERCELGLSELQSIWLDIECFDDRRCCDGDDDDVNPYEVDVYTRPETMQFYEPRIGDTITWRDVVDKKSVDSYVTLYTDGDLEEARRIIRLKGARIFKRDGKYLSWTEDHGLHDFVQRCMYEESQEENSNKKEG